jgi:hypothetical protein
VHSDAGFGTGPYRFQYGKSKTVPPALYLKLFHYFNGLILKKMKRAGRSIAALRHEHTLPLCAIAPSRTVKAALACACGAAVCLMAKMRQQCSNTVLPLILTAL